MFQAEVKATFKNQKEIVGKTGDGKPIFKRYKTTKKTDFYDSVEEAVKDLGARNVLNMVNDMVKANFQAGLRDKLQMKVLGGSAMEDDLEEVELD